MVNKSIKHKITQQKENKSISLKFNWSVHQDLRSIASGFKLCVIKKNIDDWIFQLDYW